MVWYFSIDFFQNFLNKDLHTDSTMLLGMSTSLSYPDLTPTGLSAASVLCTVARKMFPECPSAHLTLQIHHLRPSPFLPSSCCRFRRQLLRPQVIVLGVLISNVSLVRKGSYSDMVKLTAFRPHAASRLVVNVWIRAWSAVWSAGIQSGIPASQGLTSS